MEDEATARYTEQFKKRETPLSLADRIAENNRERAGLSFRPQA